MSLIDTNAVLREYLASGAGATATLVGLVETRIYSPRLPEQARLPAVSFLTRGGSANPEIPDLPNPSIQFDCWASTPIVARQVYRALYDALQGIEDTSVAIGAVPYKILSAIEEVQGQDLMDIDIPDRFRVLTFFSVIIRMN